MRKAVGILLCALSAAVGADRSVETIRSAAARGMALVQSSQKIWFTKQSCASCHQQLLPEMAAKAAREHGIPLNEDIARGDVQKAFGYLTDLDRAVQYSYIIDPSS